MAKKIIESVATLVRKGQEASFDGGVTWGRVKSVQALVVMADGTKKTVSLSSLVHIREDDPELCPNGQDLGTECREIDPCESCQQDIDEEGDRIEASMGLCAPVVEDDDEDEPDPYRKCRGCSGGCCTGGSDPCTC
jgi:hypothetical protein